MFAKIHNSLLVTLESLKHPGDSNIVRFRNTPNHSNLHLPVRNMNIKFTQYDLHEEKPHDSLALKYKIETDAFIGCAYQQTNSECKTNAARDINVGVGTAKEVADGITPIVYSFLFPNSLDEYDLDISIAPKETVDSVYYYCYYYCG